MRHDGFPRRVFLRLAGGAAVGAVGLGRIGDALASAVAAPGAAAAASLPDFGLAVSPFPLSRVTLLPGPFKSNMDRTSAYLKFVDPDRLLHTFRLNVGLPSSATAVGGWEAPDVMLRGHSTGHLLTALAQAFANTGDAAFKTKGDGLVTALAQCQQASVGAGFHAGYLSAFPESIFDMLEAGQSVWAPYYTIHKIMAGLLDQNLLAGNAQALTVVTAMASWVKTRTDRLTHAQMQAVLQTEFGGMAEVLTNLYQVTANLDHLTTAQRFDHDVIFDPLANRQDQLNNHHANTQIPKIIGALREFEQTQTQRYFDIASFFWDVVIQHHTYVIGGNSNGEFFKPPDAIASQLSDTTCETCNTYNMLKLTRRLFFHDPTRADYMDYYERGLFNQVLGQQDPASSHGFVAYYQPLRAGGIKTYSNDYNNFTCDHGTGMESNTKYADTIYLSSGETLYVNLFIASQLNWSERGIIVRQDTTFPEQSATRLTIGGAGGHIALKLRIPSWTRAGATVAINGVAQAVSPAPGSYLTLDRTWAAGDTVDLALPRGVAMEATPDDPRVQAVVYGGMVLSGGYGTTNLTALPTLDTGTLAPDTTTPMQFTATADGARVTLLPFYKMHHQRYTVYWMTPGAPPPVFVAWYRFDETSGTRAADATGNGRNATLAGAASWAPGRLGGSVVLDGASGHVQLPSGILSGVNDVTVAAFVRLDTTASWRRLFDFGSGTTANMFLVPRSGSNTMRFAITTGGAGTEQRIDAPALPTGVWKHVAVTLSGGVGILYVDGAEVARNSAMTLRPSSLGTTSQNWIGRSQYSADPFLDGQVDDFRIHSRALSPSEIAALSSQA